MPRGEVPKVKTGPTRGQERSRNQTGEWRKKRSDTAPPRPKQQDQRKRG